MTFVGASSNSGTGASVSVPAPSGLQSGDHQLLVTISGTSGGSYPTISGFDRVGEFSGMPSGDDSSWRGAIYTASNSSTTGSINITNPNSARLFTVARAAWRGGAGWLTSPAPSATTRSSSTSHALPDQATTAAGQTVVGAIAYDSGDGNAVTATFSMPAPWSERIDITPGAGFETQSIAIFDTVRTGSGTQSGTVTASRADASFVFAATLDAAAPPTPPGSVFDLTNWKLTLPVEDPEDPGDALEITQPELDTYSDEFFELDGANRMVFTAPVQGGTTPGSAATRSELREMEGGVEASWTPFDAGVRQLTVTMRVDPTGSTDREESIIAQIHAGANPAIYLAAEWESSGSPVTPRIRVFKDNLSGSSSGVGNLLSGLISTTTDFTIRIRVENEEVNVYAAVGDESNLPALNAPDFSFDATADFADDAGWYFKCGAYNKSEVVDGGTGEVITAVSFLELIQPSGVVVLEGDSAAAAAATGSLSAARPLSGDASVAAQASGSASVARSIAGFAAAAASAATGQLGIVRSLAGAASAAAATSGELSIQGDANLAGSGDAAVAATGTLSVARPLQSAASAVGEASGTATVARSIAGDAAAASAAAGQLGVARSLAGTSSAAVAASGVLSNQGEVDFAGSAAAAVQATGTLSVVRAFSGVAAAAASLSDAELSVMNFVCQNLAASVSAESYGGAVSAVAHGGSVTSRISHGATSIGAIQYGATDIALCGR